MLYIPILSAIIGRMDREKKLRLGERVVGWLARRKAGSRGGHREAPKVTEMPFGDDLERGKWEAAIRKRKFMESTTVFPEMDPRLEQGELVDALRAAKLDIALVRVRKGHGLPYAKDIVVAADPASVFKRTSVDGRRGLVGIEYPHVEPSGERVWYTIYSGDVRHSNDPLVFSRVMPLARRDGERGSSYRKSLDVK